MRNVTILFPLHQVAVTMPSVPVPVLFSRSLAAHCCSVPCAPASDQRRSVMTWRGPPDCDTWRSFCYVLVSSCLFLSPNPIIVFLQLCDMSAAVLDTCEGHVQGKRPQPRLRSTRRASQASALCPALCMSLRPAWQLPSWCLPQPPQELLGPRAH